MKTISLSMVGKFGMLLLMMQALLIPKIFAVQTNVETVPDSAVTPWLGTWTAADGQSTPAGLTRKEPKEKTVLEIRPVTEGNGFYISRESAGETISETIIPDGVPRAIDSQSCAGTQTYRWEPQAGLILGTSEITCQNSAPYSINTLKMMTADDRMVDILSMKTEEQTRLAVRQFTHGKEISSVGDIMADNGMIVARTALAAPWDLNTIIHLAGIVETPVLEAALLEKNIQVKLDPKTLRQLKSANMPDSIIDLMVALSAPRKFNIEKNGQIAAETRRSDEGYVLTPAGSYYAVGYYDYWGNYLTLGRNYWHYSSPFWWGYPIYAYYPGYYGGNHGGSGSVGGGSGVPGGTPGQSDSYSGGQLSSGSGYVQVAPRNTGHRAVPRQGGSGGGVGSSAGYSGGSGVSSAGYSGGSSAGYSGGSSAGYSGGSGGGSSAGSGGGSSAGSASPSGYSGGSGGGTAAPR